MLLLCTLPAFVHCSFVSRDIITSSDNALIQGLVQGTKGVSHGSKLIRKLPPCSLNLPSRLLCPSLSTYLSLLSSPRFSPLAYTFSSDSPPFLISLSFSSCHSPLCFDKCSVISLECLCCLLFPDIFSLLFISSLLPRYFHSLNLEYEFLRSYESRDNCENCD